MNHDLETEDLLTALQSGNKAAFEAIYNRMAAKLLQYVNSRVHDRLISEEIVQEVFVSLWIRRKELGMGVALEPYLFSACKYQVLSYIRSEKVRHRYAEHLTLFATQQHDNSAEELMNLADLKAVIEEHIAQLPPKCQEAFRLSRYTHKSITEIAQAMGISTRTVENYITQALKHLRNNLSHYQWLLMMMVLCPSS